MSDRTEAPASAGPRPVSSVPGGEEEPQSEMPQLRRRPMWPFFAVLFAIVAAVGGGIYWFATRPDPFKVLVAIDVDGQWWEGSKPAAGLADEIAAGLEKIGFEPVKGGDPEVDKILSSSKTPEEAARRLGAGFVITGSLAPEKIEHKVGEQTFMEVRSKAVLRVVYIGDKDGKAAEVNVDEFVQGMNKDAALAALSDRIAERVFDAAVPKILEHEVIKSQLDEGDITAVVRLKKAKDYVDIRARRLEDTKKAYDKIDQDHAESKGELSPITYYGTFAEQSYLAAAGTDKVLILTSSKTPFIHPARLELAWATQLETLTWRTADRKDELLWTGYHIMGFPSAATKSSRIVFVEDLYGYAKTISTYENGKTNRLRVDARARFDELTIAPSGGAVAVYERPCRDCGSNFNVISLSDGKSLYFRDAAPEVPGDEQKDTYYGFTWIDDNQILLAMKDNRPPPPEPEPTEEEKKEAEKKKDKKDKKKEGEGDGDEAAAEEPEPPAYGGPELRVIDLSKQPPVERVIHRFDIGESCFSPEASPDGKTIVMTCNSHVTFFDVATGEMTPTRHPASISRWSPDGTKVVTSWGGDIWMVTLADKSKKQLTDNDFAENQATFSADGKRVYFQSQAEDPNNSGRVASVIASVEVK